MKDELEKFTGKLSDKHIVMAYDLESHEAFVCIKDATKKDLFVTSALLDKQLCNGDLDRLEELIRFKLRVVEVLKAEQKQ